MSLATSAAMNTPHDPNINSGEIAFLRANARENVFALICKQRTIPADSNLSQEISSILRQQDTKCFDPIFLG